MNGLLRLTVDEHFRSNFSLSEIEQIEKNSFINHVKKFTGNEKHFENFQNFSTYASNGIELNERSNFEV